MKVVYELSGAPTSSSAPHSETHLATRTSHAVEDAILWLGEARAHDRCRVGGKVANLSRLAANHRIPPGFCLTADAFQLKGVDDVETGRDSLTRAVVPAPQRLAIAAAYRSLCEPYGSAELPVAVRSSAVDEDGVMVSFAGQHDTYLNVRGVDSVINAVERCWQSALSGRALEYRRLQGISSHDVRLAVLVQQLVPADASAVVFSANPITRSRQEIMVTASWGLGESVVAGTVTPDTYVVAKGNLTISSRCIAEKRRMTVATVGGVREVDVPRLLRTRPAVDDAIVIDMARLARTLEAEMGWPVDVECAVHRNTLYLLQCRPITALRPEHEFKVHRS